MILYYAMPVIFLVGILMIAFGGSFSTLMPYSTVTDELIQIIGLGADPILYLLIA